MPDSSIEADVPAPAFDSLTGLAVGDAFGAQFYVPERLALLRRGELPEPPWPWTDDTEMACSVLDVLRWHGTVDQESLAQAFAHRHDFDRGYGAATNRLLHQVRDGGDWRMLARGLFDGQGSWGNGAAMRVAPLGAWFAADAEQAAWEAARSAEVTHTHPEAVAGAIAVAVAVAVAARSRGVALQPDQLLGAAIEFTPASRVGDGIREALDLAGEPHPELAAHRLGNGRLVSAVDTVPFALWCAALHPDDYLGALWSAASVGGDVDTTCAVIGGVLGARLGRSGIPARLLQLTEPLPSWLDGLAAPG
ncbi:ADP-ribosylglycohydrolase family protein [Streptacidiphilus monticola]|uniref:ADP-ribosylglycohydrolase family protein n=1 Tax=Streptacidiphilus monticola TaxID=2161674 RepID=A0ABW1G0M8_9ACTN